MMLDNTMFRAREICRELGHHVENQPCGNCVKAADREAQARKRLEEKRELEEVLGIGT